MVCRPIHILVQGLNAIEIQVHSPRLERIQPTLMGATLSDDEMEGTHGPIPSTRKPFLELQIHI